MGTKGDGRLPFTRVVAGFGARRMMALLGCLWSGKPRSLAEDAGRVVSLMNPQPRVEGLHLVPRRDPFVLIGNHYEAPGLWVGWVAAAITNAVAEAREPGCKEMHWLVHPEWRWFEAAGRWVPNPASSVLFPRAIRTFGLIPTPPRPHDVAGRARALRHILTQLRPRGGNGRPAPAPIGLFPEGSATFALHEAMAGTGAFLHRISSLGVPLLPVGSFLEDGVLVVRFGEPFSLSTPTAAGQEDLDSWARRRLMVAIGRLLPPHLWGFYASEIERAV